MEPSYLAEQQHNKTMRHNTEETITALHVCPAPPVDPAAVILFPQPPTVAGGTAHTRGVYIGKKIKGGGQRETGGDIGEHDGVSRFLYKQKRQNTYSSTRSLIQQNTARLLHHITALAAMIVTPFDHPRYLPHCLIRSTISRFSRHPAVLTPSLFVISRSSFTDILSRGLTPGTAARAGAGGCDGGEDAAAASSACAALALLLLLLPRRPPPHHQPAVRPVLEDEPVEPAPSILSSSPPPAGVADPDLPVVSRPPPASVAPLP